MRIVVYFVEISLDFVQKSEKHEALLEKKHTLHFFTQELKDISDEEEKITFFNINRPTSAMWRANNYSI